MTRVCVVGLGLISACAEFRFDVVRSLDGLGDISVLRSRSICVRSSRSFFRRRVLPRTPRMLRSSRPSAEITAFLQSPQEIGQHREYRQDQACRNHADDDVAHPEEQNHN